MRLLPTVFAGAAALSLMAASAPARADDDHGHQPQHHADHADRGGHPADRDDHGHHADRGDHAHWADRDDSRGHWGDRDDWRRHAWRGWPGYYGPYGYPYGYGRPGYGFVAPGFGIIIR
jgi:Ni/Co efflux regulator RcnB